MSGAVTWTPHAGGTHQTPATPTQPASTISPRRWSLKLDGLSRGLWPNVVQQVRAVGGQLESGVLDALSGGVLGIRSGRLVGSVHTVTSSGAADVKSQLYINSRYRAHEFGMTIKPRFAKMLRIPFPGGPAAFIDPYGGIRLRTVSQKFFLIKSAAGRLILVDDKTDRPWYILVRSVKMPKRPIVEPSRQAAVRDITARLSVLLAVGMEAE